MKYSFITVGKYLEVVLAYSLLFQKREKTTNKQTTNYVVHLEL